MLNKELKTDTLWNLEYASTQLDMDITFLNCIIDNYFETKEETGEQWLRWQMKPILETLRKSLENTNNDMKNCINDVYAERKAKKNIS